MAVDDLIAERWPKVFLPGIGRDDDPETAPIPLELLDRGLKGREIPIAARRAAVLAYIGNLLLRTLPAIAQEANPASDRPRIIIDMPEPDHDDPRPENPTYADLRS